VITLLSLMHRPMIKHLSIFCLLLIAGTSLLQAQEQQPKDALYSALDELDALFPTLKSIQSSYMLDGGTRSLEFVDKKENQFLLCLDNSNVTFLVQYENTEVNLEESMRQQRIYLRAKYPTDKTAVPVPFKGPAEEEIKKKLRQLIEFNPQFAKSIEVFISAMEGERMKEVEYTPTEEVDLKDRQTGDTSDLDPSVPAPDLPQDLDFNVTP